MLTGGHTLLRAVFGSRERPGIPTVMIEAFNVMQDRITRARMAGDPPDVLVAPKVGAIGWFDFHRAAEAIELGVQATEKVLPEIKENIAALSTPTVPIEAIREAD
jgi:NTE family protein